MNTSRFCILTTLSASALLAFAGSALAGTPGQCEAAARAGVLTGNGRVAVLPVRADDAQSQHQWSDGDDSVIITRDNGKVRVMLNGKEIMNLDDADLFESEIGDAREHAERAQAMVRRFRDRAGEAGPGQAQVFAFGEQPKVMIGVTMETLEEAGREAPTGVNAEKATLITRVVEGLPADKSGLKEGDIIVAINGSPSAAPDDIRTAIKEKSAGDSLGLRIVRDGSEKDLTITLAAYDAEKLGAPMAWGPAGAGARAHRLSGEDLKNIESLRDEMAKKAAELEKAGAALAGASDDKERDHLEQKMARLGAEMADLGSRMGGMTGYGGQWRFFSDENSPFNLPRMRIEGGDNGPSKAFIFTPEGMAGPGERVRRLDERLQRLEEMLEKITKQLEKEER